MKFVTLVSGDGRRIKIDFDTAKQMELIRNILDLLENTEEIPISELDGDVLNIVVNFCTNRKFEHDFVQDERMYYEIPFLNNFDLNFCEELLEKEIFDKVFKAAHFLREKNLMDVLCKYIVIYMKVNRIYYFLKCHFII